MQEEDSRKKDLRSALAAILLGAGVFFLLLFASQLASSKIHIHIPMGRSGSGKASSIAITHNLAAADLFKFAQEHDCKGETDLATEDFQKILSLRNFESHPDKVKHLIKELCNSRDSVNSPDYFSYLLCTSRIGYWSPEQMPIKVYVPDKNESDGLSDFDRRLIEDCFKEWCSIIPDKVSFKMVDTKEAADISFSQKNNSLDLSFSKAVLAHTIPTPSGPEHWSVFPAGKAKIEPLKIDPEINSRSDKRAALRRVVLLHEIGHALGIIGHSSHAGDLMFFSGSRAISQRDKNTFKEIYKGGNLYKRAEDCLRREANKKNKDALLRIAGELGERGTGTKAQQAESFNAANQAAKLGAAQALVALGWMYYGGHGCKRDLKKAAECFIKAEKLERPSALIALAMIYERGDGVRADLMKAQERLKKALKMDLLSAPIAYGNFLSYQYPGQESFKKAFNFYQRNASNNQTDGLNKLAICYEHGQGVKKDLIEAGNCRNKAKELVSVMQAKDAVAYFNRACAWAEIGEYERAIKDLDQALKLKPDAVEPLKAKSAALDACGKQNESIEVLNNLLAVDPNCFSAYMRRAYCRFALGNWQGCLQDVEQIRKLSQAPDADRTYALLLGSLCKSMLNDKAGASLMLEEAQASASPGNWPFPIVQFLQGKLSKAEFEKFAIGFSKTTEVKFYLAAKELSEGKKQDATENLSWIRKEGDKQFYEYFTGLGLLKLLENKRI